MFIGNIQANNFFLGSSQVNEIWLGSLKVWQRVDEWECVIDNVSINYLPYSASVNSILPTGNNYANVVGRVRIYKNGELVESYATMTLDVSTSSNYVTNSSNKLYFNVSSYGTTNMSQSDPFTINVSTSYSGYTGPTVQVAVTPNKLISTSLNNYACSGITNTEFLNYNQTTFSITNRNLGYYRTTYTSGKYTDSTSGLTGYLYKYVNSSTNEYVGSVNYGSSISVNIGTGNNTMDYPLIFMYRLNKAKMTSGYDDWIYMMQKCRNNTSGMHIYYNNNEVNGKTIEASGYLYLANNGHTSSTTYTWTCEDSSVIITEENGIFIVEATSSSYGRVSIRDNYGNTCSFIINEQI